VSIASPANGAVYKNNGAVNITASASDTTGILSITITVDGSTLASCANATSCSGVWQGKKIAPGTHTIRAIAVNTMRLPATTSVLIVKM
jgi:hypothetical protein